MPPSPQLVSAEQLAQLFLQHGFDEKLERCKKLSSTEPQSAYHETFCCTRELVRYIDSANEEIAVVVFQTDSHGDKSRNQRIIRRLLIGSDLYVLKHTR